MVPASSPATASMRQSAGGRGELRPPANAIWRLMVASYFAGFIWELSFIPSYVFWTLSLLLVNLGQAIFAHLLLAFPSGRLRSSAERVVVAFIYAYAVGTPLLQ